MQNADISQFQRRDKDGIGTNAKSATVHNPVSSGMVQLFRRINEVETDHREGLTLTLTLTLTLIETDHREGAATLLQVLKELFQAADEDKSGALDRMELAKLVQTYYQLMEHTTLTKVPEPQPEPEPGTEPGVGCVQVKALAMTDEAIERFDEDGSELIEFEEFVAMFVCNQPPFISKLPNVVCAELDHMLTNGKVAEVPPLLYPIPHPNPSPGGGEDPAATKGIYRRTPGQGRRLARRGACDGSLAGEPRWQGGVGDG